MQAPIKSSASRGPVANSPATAGKPAVGASAAAAAPNTHILKHPLTVDGKTISVVTFRRPKARDMIVIADALPVLTEMSERVQATLKEAGVDGLQSTPEIEMKIGLLLAKQMTPATFRAMVTVASQLADLGEAAMDLDYADLSPIAMGALALLGE
jgi:hypothetical protein